MKTTGGGEEKTMDNDEQRDWREEEYNERTWREEQEAELAQQQRDEHSQDTLSQVAIGTYTQLDRLPSIMMTEQVSTEQLVRSISAANGRRRERLLTPADIMHATLSLEPGGHTFLHGGHVSKSYGYTAQATIAVVWRDSAGKPWAIVRVGSATKGSTGFGQLRAWQPPEDNSQSIALPDIYEITGMGADCDVHILADMLEDIGHNDLANMLR